MFDSKMNSGTIITLTALKRKTQYDLNALAFSLAMLFNFNDAKFQVSVSLNDGEPF